MSILVCSVPSSVQAVFALGKAVRAFLLSFLSLWVLEISLFVVRLFAEVVLRVLCR